MDIRSENKSSNTPRVLLFSQRNLYDPEVWRCSFYEFEEILRQIESVEMLAPKPGKWFKHRRRNAQRIGKYSSIILNPGIPKIKLDRCYDLFFAVCEKPSELLNVNAVEGWKDFCKTSVCWLPEFYVKDIPSSKASLRVLSKFDYVLFMFDKSEPFKKVIQGEGSYLPAGIDAILFCPYPKPSKRSIDVLSIGRRSEQTHQALLRMAKENKIFYVYDTLTDLHSYNIEQHRFLMANMAKRSRYFIVNPGKIDTPEETGGQSEFGYRYFEGAAPGTIMIGEVPKNKEFGKIFNWPDAVIHLPFGSDKIDAIINEVDTQPDRQEKIRRNNVVQSLMRHDWVYRWERILEIAGLNPMAALMERKKRLRDLSNMVEKVVLP
jgi:hypothetical protein